MARPAKRTEIVATIGPASDSTGMLRRLMEAGMDVARLNFSHRSAEQAKPLVERIRKVSHERGVFTAVLGDLRGPRIRVGKMQDGAIELVSGRTVTLSPEAVVGTSEKAGVSFKGLAHDVARGTVILLEDGNLELQVLEVRLNHEVLRGGQLHSNKGVNLNTGCPRCPR